jgi:hypothetical protein
LADSIADAPIGTIWSSSPVDDQGRYVDHLQVLGEVGLGEGLDAIELVLDPAHPRLQPEGVAQALRDLGPRPVRAVEGDRRSLKNCDRSA